MPPYGYIVEIESKNERIREKVFSDFLEAGIFVMDPGENNLPLYVHTKSLDNVRKVLEPYYSVINSKITITIKSE